MTLTAISCSSTAAAQTQDLQTPRLILRPARSSDVHDFHEFFSDDEVMTYWSNAPHTELSQTQKYLDGMVSSQWNGIRDFVLELKTPTEGRKKVVGKAGLWDGHEIGFLLSRSWWHKGYMAEALSALLPHIWATTSPRSAIVSETATGSAGEEEVKQMMVLDEIIADVDPRNNASLGILERFGFRKTGVRERTIETHLGWCDSVYLGLNRPDQ